MFRLKCGQEPYLIDGEITKLKSSVDEMNYTCFDELTEEVLEYAQQYPFFSDQRVVVVQLDKLPDAEQCVNYFDQIPEFTELILYVKNVDKRSRMFKEFQKRKAVTEYNKMDTQNVATFIKEQVHNNGSIIEDDVIAYFIRYIGYEADEAITLYNVKNAIRQLCFGSKTITTADITAMVEESKLARIWDIVTYLLENDTKRMSDVLTLLLEEKENPIAILSLLLRSFRIMYKISLLHSNNISEISKALNLTTYQLKPIVSHQFTPQIVSDCMDLLQLGVNRIKCGIASGRVIVFTTLTQVWNKLYS